MIKNFTLLDGDIMTNSSTAYAMPAGDYYFGDPCYVINDGWSDLLKEVDYMEDFSNTKRVVRAGPTTYGDGIYSGTGIMKGHRFPVDAGLLGFVPFNEMEVDAESAKKSGKVINMPMPFLFEVVDGKYYVDNKLIVDTSPDADDYEDYCDEDYYCDEEDYYDDEEEEDY